MKATLRDIKNSRFPTVIGACRDDTPTIAGLLNECIQRLINVAGETGWAFGWKRVAFTISRANPYITLPRSIARIINLDVCRCPINMNNEFYEFLPGGVGLKGIAGQPDWCGSLDGFERGTVPTMVDLTSTNQYIRVYLSDVRDIGKRILIQGVDQNGLEIYSQDGLNTVDGFFITFASPFADYVDPTSGLPIIVTQIESVQKDITYGDIVLKQVDATTGAEVTLARYAPDETNPAYRRYYLSHLPNCCFANQTTAGVVVTAIAKLEFIPVSRDTDQLLIGNIPALIEEAQSIRYSQMDVPTAAGLELKHHRRAIKLLQDELRHYEGEQRIAVAVVRWPEPLSYQAIGTLI